MAYTDFLEEVRRVNPALAQRVLERCYAILGAYNGTDWSKSLKLGLIDGYFHGVDHATAAVWQRQAIAWLNEVSTAEAFLDCAVRLELLGTYVRWADCTRGEEG